MNGSPNDPMNGRGGISEAVAFTLRQTSFLRVMVVLAATGVVLVIIRLGAPILNPIFFAHAGHLPRDPLAGGPHGHNRRGRRGRG